MNTLKEKVNYLNTQIAQGNILGVFEELYADNVVMQENNEVPREGKDVNREYEKKFLDYVAEWKSMNIDAVATDDETGVATIQSSMEFVGKDGNHVARTQVAVQKWENGKIVHERFFYGN